MNFFGNCGREGDFSSCYLRVWVSTFFLIRHVLSRVTADFHVNTQDGYTALSVSAALGKDYCAFLLVEAGADTTIRNKVHIAAHFFQLSSKTVNIALIIRSLLVLQPVFCIKFCIFLSLGWDLFCC